jgi:hypothetical protein
MRAGATVFYGGGCGSRLFFLWPIKNMLSPGRGCRRFVRKGLEGFSHGEAGAGARERGAPQSPVFCGAKNAPRY